MRATNFLSSCLAVGFQCFDDVRRAELLMIRHAKRNAGQGCHVAMTQQAVDLRLDEVTQAVQPVFINPVKLLFKRPHEYRAARGSTRLLGPVVKRRSWIGQAGHSLTDCFRKLPQVICVDLNRQRQPAMIQLVLGKVTQALGKLEASGSGPHLMLTESFACLLFSIEVVCRNSRQKYLAEEQSPKIGVGYVFGQPSIDGFYIGMECKAAQAIDFPLAAFKVRRQPPIFGRYLFWWFRKVASHSTPLARPLIEDRRAGRVRVPGVRPWGSAAG